MTASDHGLGSTDVDNAVECAENRRTSERWARSTRLASHFHFDTGQSGRTLLGVLLRRSVRRNPFDPISRVPYIAACPRHAVETRTGWINGRQAELLEAAQRAIVEGIRIPEADRCVRLHELPAEAILAPPGTTEKYTIIEISMFKGRSVEAKRRLYAALARELGAFGLEPHDIKVYIQEGEREDWSVGGVALSDVELGFTIEV